jgi:hypothetical protein
MSNAAAPEQAQIRVSSPGDLIELVPYLLGFPPVESLVVIGLAEREGRMRVCVSARADLPTDGRILPVAGPCIEAMPRSGATQVAFLLFSESDRSQLRQQGLDAAELAKAADLMVMDVLIVDAKRWWSVLCEEPGCCPPEGHPRTADSRVAAEAVLAGIAPLADRAELEKVFEPVPSGRRMAEALAHSRRRLEIAANPAGLEQRLRRDADLLRAEIRRREDDPTRRLTDNQVARLGSALRDIEARDGVWMDIDDRTITDTSVLVELMTRLPGELAAAPLFLYGWAQWRLGSGTVAMMAADRALEADEDYSAARLLGAAVQRGMNPTTTPTLRDLGEAADE